MQESDTQTFLKDSAVKNDSMQNLNILLVSDIHNAFNKLDKLKVWYDENPQKFDYVFALGDFDVIFADPGESISETNNNYTLLKKNLEYLEYFSAPIIYIPGNHDPIGLFQEDPKLTTQSTLVQNQSYMIGEKLQIIGFGGSLPGYFEKDMNFVDFPGSYPFRNEEEYSEGLNKLLEKYCNHEIQTILLTHLGPFYSSTNIIYDEIKEGSLCLGSKELDKALKNSQWNILADLHGHVHPSVGRTNIGKVQVINPGSVFEGNFGILRLQRSPVSEKWIIKRSEFITLNEE